MRAVPLLLLLAASACSVFDVGFGRKVSDDELRLRTDVRAYYDEVIAAFALGNADALTRLFDPAIAKPMTRDQIQAWGTKFFAENGGAAFKVERLEFERLGFENAVVLLTYSVKTKGGKGDFGGTERDYLVKRGKRWIMTSWEKADPPKSSR